MRVWWGWGGGGVGGGHSIKVRKHASGCATWPAGGAVGGGGPFESCGILEGHLLTINKHGQ